MAAFLFALLLLNQRLLHVPLTCEDFKLGPYADLVGVCRPSDIEHGPLGGKYLKKRTSLWT